MYMKICLVGDVLDLITCAKFQNEICRGYNFTVGRIFHFLLIFEWALLVKAHLYFFGKSKNSLDFEGICHNLFKKLECHFSLYSKGLKSKMASKMASV